MPKKAKELTSLEVMKITNDGLHAVGGVSGLCLQIIGKARSWVLRTTIDGKQQKIGLGSCTQIKLAMARDKAREHLKQIKDGVNPVKERRAARIEAMTAAAKAKTFKQCAGEYLAAHRVGWVDKHALRYENSLALHVYPIIGSLPVANVDTTAVLEVLTQPVETADGIKSLWEARTDTASRVRGRIESVLQYARACGLRPPGENPASWQLLKFTLPKKSAVYKEENFTALPYAEIGAFMADLRKREGMSARALEFAILTAARSQEVRLARWNEIDFTARIWNVPAEHMKMKREHTVPLSDVAVKLLEALPCYEGNGHIFPPVQADELSDMALLMVVRRMHEKKKQVDGRGYVDPKLDNRIVTVHGFRSSFKDWAEEETTFQPKTVEFALAHKLPDRVEGAYQRGSLLEKRRALMDAWSRYCETVQTAKKDNVIPMRKAV